MTGLQNCELPKERASQGVRAELAHVVLERIASVVAQVVPHLIILASIIKLKLVHGTTRRD